MDSQAGMRMRYFAVLIVMFTVLPGTSPSNSQNAPANSGNFWHPICKARDGKCLGFVSAVDEFNKLHSITRFALRYCPPAGVTLEQLSDVVAARLEAVPEDRHKDFMWIAFMALMAKFPCAN